MTKETAVALIRRLVEAEVHVVKCCNGQRGIKSAEREEAKAVFELFVALTGNKPTVQELDAICKM